MIQRKICLTKLSHYTIQIFNVWFFFLFSFLEEDSDTMSVSVLLDGEESSLEFLDVHAQVARFFSTSHFFFSTYSVQIHMIKNCNIFFCQLFFPSMTLLR